MPRSIRGLRWEVADLVPPSDAHTYEGIHGLLAQLLYNRGLRDRASVEAFLAGPEATLADARRMRGTRDAVGRVLRALDHGERIALYGDYDVDGLTGLALLHETLERLGGDVVVHIPHREREGYGLRVDGLRALADQGATLVVAVDCGINARTEIDFAHTRDLDVIVVDHHHFAVSSQASPPLPVGEGAGGEGHLPRAFAIVSPVQPDCPYPFKQLAAVGLCHRLAHLLLAERAGPAEGDRIAESLLDLVALGTVADVVPLVGENRTLAARGLRVLNRGPASAGTASRVGLEKLILAAGLRAGAIDAYAIGHTLGPRLNAAGRLDDARHAYALLRSRDPAEATALAESLDTQNRRRQQQTSEAVARAYAEIGERIDDVLVVAGSEYPAGIVGLVASRLTESFYRPSLVIALREDEARGSARSIDEVHIAAALDECRHLLRQHGGHARAAGFTLDPANLGALRDELRQVVGMKLARITTERGYGLVAPLRCDGYVNPRRIDRSVYHTLRAIEPCGEGNPAPRFVGRAVDVVASRAVGGQSSAGGRTHLRLNLGDGRTRWTGIAFGLGAHADKLPSPVDIAYRVVENEWNGAVALELHVEDIAVR